MTPTIFVAEASAVLISSYRIAFFFFFLFVAAPLCVVVCTYTNRVSRRCECFFFCPGAGDFFQRLSSLPITMRDLLLLSRVRVRAREK